MESPSPSPLLPAEPVELVEAAEPVGRLVLRTFVETGLAKSISSSDLSPRPGPKNRNKRYMGSGIPKCYLANPWLNFDSNRVWA